MLSKVFYLGVVEIHSVQERVNLLSNNPDIYGPWKRSPLKTMLGEVKEKMLVTGTFSISHIIVAFVEDNATISTILYFANFVRYLLLTNQIMLMSSGENKREMSKGPSYSTS